MNESKKITIEQAEELLPDKAWIHVFMIPGHPDGEMWSRTRILREIEKRGAELAGQEAQKHQHAIVITSADGLLFIQNRKEKKNNEL